MTIKDKFRLASVAGALLMVFSINGIAQQSAAGLRITGRVSAAVKLSLVSGWQAAGADGNAREAALKITAHEEGNDLVAITLSATGRTSPASISIPLEIRANAPYELLAAAVYSDSCAPAITVRIDSIRVSGQHTVRDAAERASIIAAQGHLDTTLARLLNGPRISRTGNFFTPTNALAVGLTIMVSEPLRAACDWRADLRLSLRPLAED